MLGDQRGEIESDRLSVRQPPFACDHHPVGAMGAAKDERRERIMRAREARLVELEQRGFSAVGNFQLGSRAAWRLAHWSRSHPIPALTASGRSLCAQRTFAMGHGTPALGRLDPFAASFGYDRYLRIPAGCDVKRSSRAAGAEVGVGGKLPRRRLGSRPASRQG
jgi:hypothetical protein